MTLLIEPGMEFPELDSEQAAGYVVVLEHDESGWSAFVPDLPGVVAAAADQDTLAALIADAVEFHLEGLRLAGEAVPPPTARAMQVSP